MERTLIVMVAMAASIAGCAWTPQAVQVKPDIQVQQGTVGNGRTVMVAVEDERPKTTLGTRGVRGVGADITVEGNLSETIRSAVIDGLQRQGFTPVTTATGDNRALRVELRNLDYEVIQGFWTGTVRTGCGVKANCVIGSARPYEHMYKAEQSESTLFVKGAEANAKFVNGVVSKALNDMLSDEGLTRCLAQ